MRGASEPGPLPFLAVLVVALLVVLFAAQTPEPLGADIAPDQFSATRAMRDVEMLAQHPHPSGSAEHERVRLAIAGRLSALGLEPVLDEQPVPDGHRADWFKTGKVKNISAVLQGLSPDLPAILLMSHYDTVPGSPGAADDTAAVAAMLEIIANLNASGRLRRDMIFLFTDGEEAGLLGARAYFADADIDKRVGLVLNMEARGAGGRAFMFETGRQAGGLIRVFGDAVSRPSANSLMALVYRNMPNDTDLTITLKRGIPGMNFAFIGDEAAYHTAVATPDRLNTGSLQHMGEQVLALTRSFAALPVLPRAEPDLVYSDVLGSVFIAYPIRAGWGLVFLCAILLTSIIVKARRGGLIDLHSVLSGAGAFLLLFFTPAILLSGSSLFLLFTGPETHQAILSRVAFHAIGSGLIVMGSMFFVLFLIRPRFTVWNLWAGGLLLAFMVLLLMQIMIPQAAFLVAWILMLSLVAAFIVLRFREGQFDRPASWAIIGLMGLPSSILSLQWGAVLFAGVGVLLPSILAIPAFLILLALLPLVYAAVNIRHSAACMTGILGLGLMCLLWAAL